MTHEKRHQQPALLGCLTRLGPIGNAIAYFTIKRGWNPEVSDPGVFHESIIRQLGVDYLREFGEKYSENTLSITSLDETFLIHKDDYSEDEPETVLQWQYLTNWASAIIKRSEYQAVDKDILDEALAINGTNIFMREDLEKRVLQQRGWKNK